MNLDFGRQSERLAAQVGQWKPSCPIEKFYSIVGSDRFVGSKGGDQTNLRPQIVHSLKLFPWLAGWRYSPEVADPRTGARRPKNG